MTVPRLTLAAAVPRRIIDAHIHLFDPRRPDGVPWPEPGDVIRRPSLPPRYERIAGRYGVVGAIAIEASPLKSDNDWLLHTVERYPVMVGMVGNLEPSDPSFAGDLERLHRSPLFLGIRYGNLWKRDLATALQEPSFVDGLRRLARFGLVLESANPDPRLIRALVGVAQRIPELTIVIDHLPNAQQPDSASERTDYRARLQELATAPRVVAKLSEVPVRREGRLDRNVAPYEAKLECIWSLFGEDRLLFGSDWPNSDHIASYGETLAIVRQFVASKGETAEEKFFMANSQRIYRWQPRRSDQRE
ncbi:MAG: amidohydrolase 2 [Acidobacteriaceae bacterium]|nr:amidohydrolase 2 [Acidobacteriaceae bacterium]